MTTLRMTVEEWIGVPDNPRQRDTERHAAKAHHLRQWSPAHGIVIAARLPNGKMIKLDGHTRALLWKRREIDRPKSLEVTIIPVKSVEEAKELYTHFDNKAAMETVTDRISGGFREIGFEPSSAFLRAGRIGSALRIAWVAVHGYARDKAPRDTYQIINEFAAEVLALDDMQLSKTAASTGIVAAFLLSYRKHGDAILPFWRAVFANGGTKTNGSMDAVQALNELMLQRQRIHGGTAANDLCARALHAVEKWLVGDMLMIPPRPLDLTTYLTKKPVKRAA